ncbi:hypothetical protein SAMN05444412_107102 [Rhodonellum ikkaensis]|uniref:Uncharacterized protein n=1 Tax=Rhodonellum ikkaensis TaxID=336829 RepID=A0A1H3R1U1_9BACT|nr:hypothetical protein SAMN05444412_107102 [Rhodonellum ikkaensis]
MTDARNPKTLNPYMHNQFYSIQKLIKNQTVIYKYFLHHIGEMRYSPNSLIFFQLQTYLETHCLFRVNSRNIFGLRSSISPFSMHL